MLTEEFEQFRNTKGYQNYKTKYIKVKTEASYRIILCPLLRILQRLKCKNESLKFKQSSTTILKSSNYNFFAIKKYQLWQLNGEK